MSYTELVISVTPPGEETNSILIAQLSELGFESFMEDDKGFRAYIKSNKDFSAEQAIESLFLPEGVSINFEVNSIADKNWNEVWESNFEPILVDNKCLVRASFHTNFPKTDYEIVIDPKMSFGTGHHQTTHLMINALLNTDVNGLTVLDMGCGTGVLAILAEMKGAANVVAIDIDEWAYRNSLENVTENKCTKTEVLLGDAALLAGKHFDLIIANINLNILLNDLATYKSSLNVNGKLFMSGILRSDVNTLIQASEKLGLKHQETFYRDDWAMVSFSN
ncbi:MAG: 50S ribosomal protein L11 methyltransferase [Bacteroidales bacterium]|nr:MAG: 50S ribosomal protein L11 methyltransferase [Bacteroidales bacterium]